jgi:hypothetical protein
MTDQDTNPPDPERLHREAQRLSAAQHLQELITERRPIVQDRERRSRDYNATQDRESRTTALANEIRQTFAATAVELRARGVKPVAAQGELLNPAGPKTRNRVNTLRHYTPAQKLKSMFPKYDEVDVWVLNRQEIKRGQYGLAFDADGNFYTLASKADFKDPQPFAVRPVEPAALGEGPDNWTAIYTHNTPPELTPEVVENWQIAAAEFVVAQTESSR